MTMFTEDEWPKLDLFTYNGWRVSLAANQHLLGWLIIFPPSEIEASIVHLKESELLDFKQVGLFCENLLKQTFNTEWFNYLQEGNGVKRIHIHLHPRYSSDRSFVGFNFKDLGWGRKVKFLSTEELPNKETVLELVKLLRQALKNNKLDLNINISET